jgi:hypothetical protein
MRCCLLHIDHARDCNPLAILTRSLSHLRIFTSPNQPYLAQFTAVKPLLFSLLLLAACASPRRTADIHHGMTRHQVIEALGRSPSYSSATPDGTEILTFTYGTLRQNSFTGEVTGARVPFSVYLRDGKVIAWGTSPQPDLRVEVNGSSTNHVKK